MTKLIYPLIKFIFLLMLLSCSQTTKKEYKNIIASEAGTSYKAPMLNNYQINLSKDPTAVLYKSDENPKLTLLKLIRTEPFNPNGYKLFSYGEPDKYGNQGSVIDDLIIILTEQQVDEIKKYVDEYTLWESEYGSKIVNLMIECFEKKQITCDCRKMLKI